jgi:asparagine synthase (glutamine-hydrolysing)
MCGIAGYMDLRNERRVEKELLMKMTNQLIHRGPDSTGYFIAENVALGFRRLSIIDLEGGDQPIFNEESSVTLICNGEIYNHCELRESLQQKGHTFRSRSDVEVLAHLYEEEGVDFLSKLNGQFAFAIYDSKEKRLFLARDQFGINPLYFTVVDGLFIFASEIKAILEHPAVPRAVDLTGLDQIFSFPGLVSPRTMFKGIESLKSGHLISIRQGDIKVAEYWDLDYPKVSEAVYDKPESDYVEQLEELLTQSVRYRLQADVPVGFYLSGGLDSSLIASLIHKVSPDIKRRSFSIGFNDKDMSETSFQRRMSEYAKSTLHEIIFDWQEIAERFSRMIYHCECPVKETYNTCSLALSAAAREAGFPVILTGEGADELFAGYVGYRLDQIRYSSARSYDLETILEDELRQKLWGEPNIFYERDHYAFRQMKNALYSDEVNHLFPEFDCLTFELVNKSRLAGRHFVHQRSYLDVKLRLSDHLISDHGDRMALANAVEARYPFLDKNLVEFSQQIPPDLKLNGFTGKYILKKVANGLVPQAIIDREKFGFHAAGSPCLLQQDIEWVKDLLSYEQIKRQGYFNPDVIESLKKQYSQDGFKLNLPFEDDFLMIVLSFGVFLQTFKLPNLN